MNDDRDPKTIDADDAVRRAYEDGEPTETDAYRDGTEPVSSAGQLAGRPDRTDDRIARLSGGDVDAAAQDLDAGIETPGGSNPTPDQDQVDAIGASVGMTYQDNEPLKFGDKMAERDARRWELDPASSDDYQERRTQEADGLPVDRRQTPTAGPSRVARTSRPRPDKTPKQRAQKAKRQGSGGTTKEKSTRRSKKRGTHPTPSRKRAGASRRTNAKPPGTRSSRKPSSTSKNRSGRQRTAKRSRS